MEITIIMDITQQRLRTMYSRQSLTLPLHIMQKLSVLTVGAGTTGSCVTSALSRMGVGSNTLYDRDVLCQENVIPGCHSAKYLGYNKAQAVKAKIHDELGFDNIIPKERFWNGQREAVDIVIIGTDTMESRQRIWEKRDRIEGWRLWIDARMGGDQASITMVRGQDNEGDKRKYAESISHPSAELACGEKATVPICGFYLPGMVASYVMRWAREMDIPRFHWAKFLMAEMFTSTQND